MSDLKTCIASASEDGWCNKLFQMNQLLKTTRKSWRKNPRVCLSASEDYVGSQKLQPSPRAAHWDGPSVLWYFSWRPWFSHKHCRDKVLSIAEHRQRSEQKTANRSPDTWTKFGYWYELLRYLSLEGPKSWRRGKFIKVSMTFCFLQTLVDRETWGRDKT